MRSQSTTGTLAGTVLDSTGAVIKDASITIKNVASGETWTSQSNHDGFFAVSTLPAAAYEVTVVANGFERYHATGIALTGGESRSMTITLKVGQTSESVEVEGNVTDLAPVNSGEKTYTISAEDLSQLSLVSRDATEIIDIMPGALMVANGGVNKAASDNQTVGLNVNGPIGNNSVNGQWIDVTMDGGHTFDPGASGNSVPVTANQDMISEVKILTSNFTADNPKGPVVVNTVSKSGGKDFHGDIRFNARNSTLNSNDAFAKANNVSKPNSSYYYPGFGVGGPIVIPGTNFNKNRQKLFFHESFEYYKQLNDYGVERAFVMTPDMLNGDFSAISSFGSVAGGSALSATPSQPNWASGAWGSPWIAYNQGAAAARLQGCTVSASGVLSPACIDPNGQALMKAYLPAPTTANGQPAGNTGFNYIKDFTGPMNANQNMAKVEWDISDNNKLSAVYNRERQTANWTLGLWTNSASDNAVPAPTGVIGGDQSDFVSTTFMHVFSPSMSSETKFNYTYLTYPESPENPSKILRDDIPNFNLKGIWDPKTAPMVVTWGAGFPNLGAIGDAFHPNFICYTKIPAVGEDLTKVVGKHTAKAGFYLEDIFHTQDNWTQFMGAISYANWAPSVTGNMYADTLTGIGLTGYYEQAQPPNPVTINSKTLSFYAQDSWEVTHRLTLQYGMRFDHYGKPYQPDYGIAVFNTKTYNNDPAQLDNNTGVEWHSQNSNVPLSGASSRLVFFSPRLGAAFDAFGNGSTIVRGGWGMYRAYDSVQSNSYTAPAQTALGSFAWTCGFNDPLCPSVEDIDTHALPAPDFGKAPLGPGLKAINTMDPTDDEQPLVTTFSATVDQKLPAKFNAEVSYVGNTSYDLQQQLNYNAIPLGTLLTNPQNCSITTVTCQSAYRPFQNYEGITNTMTAGKGRFDSMQASLQRSAGHVVLMLNYTFSKQLGNGLIGTSTSGYKDYGVKEYYGVLQGNRPQVVSAAYVFTLPKLQAAQSLVRQIAGGWELSGVTQVESGANLTSSGNSGWNLNMSLAALPNGSALDNIHLLGTPDIQLQPLITCNPRHGNPSGVYLNANCFAPPPGNGVNGTTNMPYLPGPMFWKSDLTMMKNFRIKERQSFQVRAAGFNFLNHDLLSFAPSDSNLQLIYGPDGKIDNPNFGRAMNHYGQRIMEFGAKYTF